MAGFPSRGMNPQIAELLRYAAEVAHPDPLPKRRRIQIDFKRLDALLPNIFFLEVGGDGDYYYKYSGEMMPELCGLNLCGQFLSGIADAGLRRSLKASYDRVVQDRAVYYMRGRYVWPGTEVAVQRLLIPLLNEDGTVSAICGLAVPDGSEAEWRRATGEGPAKLLGENERILLAALR